MKTSIIIISMILNCYLPVNKKQGGNSLHKLLNKIQNETDENYIIEGDCDYAIKLDSSIKAQTNSAKFGVTNFCIFSEEELFNNEIKRYI